MERVNTFIWFTWFRAMLHFFALSSTIPRWWVQTAQSLALALSVCMMSFENLFDACKMFDSSQMSRRNQTHRKIMDETVRCMVMEWTPCVYSNIPLISMCPCRNQCLKLTVLIASTQKQQKRINDSHSNKRIYTSKELN